MFEYVRDGRPGAIIVGSHVKKTTLQLEELLKEENTEGLEVEVDRIHKKEQPLMLSEIVGRIDNVYSAGKTPVIYLYEPNRTELTDFNSDEDRL